MKIAKDYNSKDMAWNISLEMDQGFTIPKEECKIKDPDYNRKNKKYLKDKAAYPDKLKKYNLALEDWKKKNKQEAEDLKNKKLEQARKLLKEAGELQ